MMLVEMLVIAVVMLALAHVVRTMRTLGHGDPGFRPGKPCDPRLLRDPITMSWDEPVGADAHHLRSVPVGVEAGRRGD